MASHGPLIQASAHASETAPTMDPGGVRSTDPQAPPAQALVATPQPGGELAAPMVLRICRRYRLWLLGALVALYLTAFNGQWRVEPDSGLYLTIARSLARGDGYVYHGQPNQLAYAGLPYLIAGTMRLCGTESLWPAHILMLLCGLACLGLTYRLMSLHAGSAVAVLLTIMLGISDTTFRYAFEMRNDLPFLLGVLAFLAGYEAFMPSPSGSSLHARWRWWDACLLVGGLAIAVVMRPAMLALLGAVLLATLWSIIRRRPGWRLRAIITGVALAAVVGFYLLDPRRQPEDAGLGLYEQSFLYSVTQGLTQTLHTAVGQNLPRILDPLVADAVTGIQLGFGWLNVLFAITILALGVSLARRRPLWGLFVLLTMVMVSAVKPEPRYLLPILPLLLYAWWLAIEQISLRIRRPWAQLVFFALLGLLIAPNIGRMIKFIIEQRSVPFLAHYRRGEFRDVPALAEAIRRNVDDDTPIAVRLRRGRVLTYLTERNVMDGSSLRTIDPASSLYIVLPEPPGEGRLKELIETRRLMLAPVQRIVDPDGRESALYLAHPGAVFDAPPPSRSTPVVPPATMPVATQTIP